MSIEGSDSLRWYAEAFYNLGSRLSGSEQGCKAENLCAKIFADLGLADIFREEINAPLWLAEDWWLELGNDINSKKFVSCYLPYSRFTQAEGCETKAVYLGEGRDADFRRCDAHDKLAVVDVRFPLHQVKCARCRTGSKALYINRPGWWPSEQYRRAVDAKAAGFLGLLRDLPAGDSYFAPSDGIAHELPGLYLGRTESERFIDCLTRDTQQPVRFKLTGATETRRAASIFGSMPGKSDELIAVIAHLDAPFGSAVGCAGGVALLCELAARLIGRGPRTGRGVLFAALAGNHCGNRGAVHLLRHRARDLLERVVCTIELGAVGKRAIAQPDGNGYRATLETSPLYLTVSGSRMLTGAALTATAAFNSTPIFELKSKGAGVLPPADASVLSRAGIPWVKVFSCEPYLETEEDTLKFLDPMAMTETVDYTIGVIDKIDGFRSKALGRRKSDMRRIDAFLQRIDRGVL